MSTVLKEIFLDKVVIEKRNDLDYPKTTYKQFGAAERMLSNNDFKLLPPNSDEVATFDYDSGIGYEVNL